MSEVLAVENDTVVNGLNVTEYHRIVDDVRVQPELAKFEFRATNQWENGGYNVTTIKGFYGAGEEQGTDDRQFIVDADEPPVLLGVDRAPNPVEYLLHALAACLTSSIVYKAASRGIHVDSIEASLEGDLDARAFLELSDNSRKGYEGIRANFRVRSQASAEVIKELAEFSPVLDVIRDGTPVSLQVEKA